MSVQTIPLSLILRAVAGEFDLPEGDLRRSKSGYADDAREAFVLVASELTLQGEMAIGEMIGRGIGFVRTALAAARFRMANDGGFACRLIGLQAEVLAEVRLAEMRRTPPRRDASPAGIARRCLGDDRAALRVTLADLRVLGAAFLALHENVVVSEPEVRSAAHAFAKAERALRDARFTPAERASRATRDAAVETLLSVTSLSKDRPNAA